MSSSLFYSAPVAAQNQAIQDYVGQVLSGNYTDQQRSQMINEQANKMGVSQSQIAQATGYSPNVISQYLGYEQPTMYAGGSKDFDESGGQRTVGATQGGSAPSRQQIDAAENAERVRWLNMGMEGRPQGVDPAVMNALYSTNAQGQTVRNSDGYVAPWSANQIQNPNAREYYQQNPQELFALGALGGGGVQQGYFQNAGVRGTDMKYGQLNPDQWYRGYTSNFADGWDKDTSNAYRWAGQNAQGGAGGVGGSGGYGGGYGGAGGGSSSSSSSTTSSGGLNPYLTSAQQAIASLVTDNLNRNILPGLSSSAVASGNFGGSRQGVIEANALNDANRQIVNGMANLSFNAYESDANRGLQQQSIDNSYNLGLGNLATGFYTAQRGQDLQSTALGAQLMNQGNANYLNAGSGIANLGTSAQQAPWQVLGNYTGAISPFTGYGATTTSNQNSNPWAQALGGAMLGGQVGKLF